jgi:hypothetical protein
MTVAIRARTTSVVDEATRAAIVDVCVAAHEEPEFRQLFAYLPPAGLHVLAYAGPELVGHAVVTTRWLQPAGLPLLSTAYVDAVAVLPSHQGASPALRRSASRSTSASDGRSGAGRWPGERTTG